MRKELYFYLKYSRISASARLRFIEYFKMLNESGYKLVVKSLFDEKYFKNKIINNQIFFLNLIISYIKRIIQILLHPFNTKVVIQIELLPYMPAILERILIWKGCKIILDLDDAFFHRYDQSNNILVNIFLKKKYNYIFENTYRVIVGSRYLEKKTKLLGAKKVVVIPTGVNFNYTKKFINNVKKKEFSIVWIGSPSTTMYLANVIPALRIFCSMYNNIKIRIIGAKDFNLESLPIEFYNWNENEEYYLLSECHVGIMPLFNDSWAKGKCAFKLIQYMSVGLPVIASPVGENLNVVTQNINGFFAKNTEEWVKYFDLLYKNRKLRKTLGKNAIKTIYMKYDTQKLKYKFIKSLL